jgi:Lipocalin-like domain
MKKLFSLCLMLVLFASCGSLNQKSQVALKGNWVISSVSYPGSEYIKVTSFDIADSKCLEGSSWNFISSNNKGSLTLNSMVAGCPTFSSPIVWTVTKEGQFTLKITDGQKAKRVTEGYVLTMQNQTESSFQLVDNVEVGGKTVAVTYNFSKI